MTTPRNPRPEPSSGRWLAGAALVVALVAVGLAAWQLVRPPETCQQEAWDVTPDDRDLPDGWSLSASQYDLGRKTISFVGPLPDDEFSAQAAIITTVTCFPDGAAEAVTRSQEAAADADQSVIEREDLGDQAFSAVDPSGATFLQLRSGRVVAYLAGTPETAATDVEALASAFDIAMGGDGGDITPAEPSDDIGLGSPDPGESFAAATHAAPGLAAMLPAQIGDLSIDVTSITGADFLGDDPGSRAVLAALREAGLEASDLKVAEGFDALGDTDLSMLAVTIDGMPVEQTRDIVLNVWLAASGPGVTKDQVTLDGEEWMRIDYGDESRKDYVLLRDDAVINVTTADPALAEQVAAALP